MKSRVLNVRMYSVSGESESWNAGFREKFYKHHLVHGRILTDPQLRRSSAVVAMCVYGAGKMMVTSCSKLGGLVSL